MPATNAQVQQWVNERTRVRAEAVRALLLAFEDDNASISDVYDALEPPESATWEDQRDDGPPHLMTASDVLAFNTFSVQLAAILRGTLANDAAKASACNDVAGQLPVVLAACVRPVG